MIAGLSRPMTISDLDFEMTDLTMQAPGAGACFDVIYIRRVAINDLEQIRENLLSFPETTEEMPFGPAVIADFLAYPSVLNVRCHQPNSYLLGPKSAFSGIMRNRDTSRCKL